MGTKKEIEEEHPEWKKLSTSGVKVPSSESSKRTLACIGTVVALFFSLRCSTDRLKRISQYLVLRKSIRYQNWTTKHLKHQALLVLKELTLQVLSIVFEESTKAESSGTESSKEETHNYDFHLPGVDDEELRRVIDRSKKILERPC